MFFEQLKHSCQFVADALSRTCKMFASFWENELYRGAKKNMLDRLNSLSHTERLTYMFLLGRLETQDVVSSVNEEDKNAEQHPEKPAKEFEISRELKALWELSNEELPYYRQVSAMCIRGVLSSFVMYVEESAHDGDIEEDTNTEAERRDAGNDDSINANITNVDDRSCELHKKENVKKALLSLYKSVEVSAHKLLHDPLPRIAQLMCSVVIRSVIGAAQIEHSDVNSRVTEVDEKLFELLVELVEHPVLLSFAVALQRVRKCYLIDKLCAKVYLGREINVKGQETLQSTLKNKESSKQEEQQIEQIHVTSTTVPSDDVNDNTSTTSADTKIETATLSLLHTVAHQAMLSPSHKNYKKLLLCCNNTELLTEIICSPAIYSTLPANVIHHLTLKHPRVMLNCVQELTCKYHLALKVTNNVSIDTKENVNTVKANSTSGQKKKPQKPCQVKQKSKEMQSMRTQYKRKKREMLTSTTACEEKTVEARKHDNKIHNTDSSTANNVELEVSISLVPFLLKVFHTLVHNRQPASVIDAATMFVFGTVSDSNENTKAIQKYEDVCTNNEKDAHTHNGSAYLDLVHFPCSDDDDKNKLIQHYFERRPRLVARFVLQHLHELPSTLHLEIQRNMCRYINHRRKCCSTTSLPSSSTSTSSNVVSLESTSCNTVSREINEEFHWLIDLITCGKVRNILQCYAQLQPELRALIYKKNKAALQSSSRQWKRSEHFTNVNRSDEHVIIDLSTLFSIPDATVRADEGRRHFVHGDRYFEDDDATRISYLSLLPVHEAIALADENEYIHNKEVNLRSSVASALIAGLPYQRHHDNTQKATELQETSVNIKGKEDKCCREQEAQEEKKTISTKSTSAVVASDQDNIDVMKVLQYCMERVNEQDPWKCAVMETWSELPCKVWKVSQNVVCNVNNKHINNITKIHEDQCINDNQNTADKAQCHNLQQCECIISSSSSSYEHVSLLIAYIQKCMSAKDISRGTLQHIALLLLKVLRGLYSTCDHADMTEADKKSVANADEKLNSVKETILEMWIKLVMQRKTITYNEKRVLSTAPEKLVSVIFEKLIETMLKQWLHADKSQRILNDSHQRMIETLINVIVGANTSSNEKSDTNDNNIADNVDKEEESKHYSDCTSSRKKGDSYAYTDMSEESQAIKLILTQTFTLKQAQTFLHNAMESFLSTYCIDYRRHYSPHLCVMAVELFFHFFTKQEQVAFVEQLLNAVLSNYVQYKENNRPNNNNVVIVDDENFKSEEKLKQTRREILLSFVSLPEIKLIIEKYLQGKYLTNVLEHSQQQEEEEQYCKLQNNTQTIASDKSAENDKTDSIIENSSDCRASQNEVVHPRLTQFACDLRKYMKEHNKVNSNSSNVSIGNDEYDFTFTCRYCKYWSAAQQQKYARTILHAVTHRYASDFFTQRELFRMLGMMSDLSLETLPLRKFIVFTSSTSQSSPSPLFLSVTTTKVVNCENDNDDDNDNVVVDTPGSKAVSTACNPEEETNELRYDKEFVRSLAIQLLGKLYDHESFDLLVELLHVDALVKEAFAALRNRFAFMLQCSSNSDNENVEKVFSLITSISSECAKVSVLKELLRYVGSMQSERAFQWLLEYGQKCKEAELTTKESSWQEMSTTSTETSASETSLVEDSEEHSNDNEEWEKLGNDEMEEDDSNNSSEASNEENEFISVEEGLNKDDDDDNHNTKEVAEEQEKYKEHAESKKYLRNKIHGMHKDVFLAYLSALINFVDKEEVWNVMQSAIECPEIKHQVLICNVICAIADAKIANVAWKRTRYTHLLLQLMQNAITEIQQRKDNNDSNNTKNRSKQQAAKSIIRSVLDKIIDSRVDGISNTLLYEDAALYPLCYNIMNKRIWTCNTNDTEQEVNARKDDESDNDEQQEELSLLSLKCLLYCSNVSVQELVKEILNVAEDWQLVKRIEQVEEVHDDFETNNKSINSSNKEDKNCKIHKEVNDNASIRTTTETNATHTTTVSKVAITLIDDLLREQRQPVLIIHLLLCTQNPQENWIKYITQMHKLELLHPDVMSTCIDVFKVEDSEAYYNYYRYENNARAFATAHIKRYKEELLTLEQTVMRHHTLPFVRRLGLAIVTYFEHYYRCDSNDEDDNDSTDGNSTVIKAERIKQCQDAILQYRNDKERWIRDAAMLVRLPKRK